MSMKHNKIKNTGILFEILCNKMTYEALNPTLPQSASKILKKHFTKDSLLLKELKLYRQLYCKESDVDTNELVNLIVENRQKINPETLSGEKYKLVKSIKKHYDLKEFFDSRVGNYKLLAAIYGVMENQKTDPTAFLKNKSVILESFSKVNEEPVEEITVDPEISKLTFKIIVEKFNEKYRSLLPNQKALISKFINTDHTNGEFKDYVLSECISVKNTLNKKIHGIDDQVLKIKLTETVGLLDTILTSKGIVKEEYISALLKYYELIEEI